MHSKLLRLELLCAQALQESVGPASAVPLLEAAHATGDGRLLAQCRRYVADNAAEVRASGGVEQLRDLGVAKGPCSATRSTRWRSSRERWQRTRSRGATLTGHNFTSWSSRSNARSAIGEAWLPTHESSYRHYHLSPGGRKASDCLCSRSITRSGLTKPSGVHFHGHRLRARG